MYIPYGLNLRQNDHYGLLSHVKHLFSLLFAHRRVGFASVTGVVCLGTAAVLAAVPTTPSTSPATTLNTSVEHPIMTTLSSLPSTDARQAPSAAIEPDSASATGPSSSSQITVNGTSITVPANGSVERVISDVNGQTTVTVSASSTSNTSNGATTSLKVDVSSHSSSANSLPTDSSAPSNFRATLSSGDSIPEKPL
jgi:hypothetical protein